MLQGYRANLADEGTAEQADANTGTLQNGKVFVGDSGVVRLLTSYAHLLLSHTTLMQPII